MGNSPSGYLGFGYAGCSPDDFELEDESDEDLSGALEKADTALERAGGLVEIHWTSGFDYYGGRVLVAHNHFSVEWAQTARIDLDTLHAFEDTARKRVLEAMRMLEAEHPLVAQYFKAAAAEPSWILWTLYG
jgi:hypothetical protein